MLAAPTKNRRAGANKIETRQEKSRVSKEGQLLDQKAVLAATGKTTDWNEIAKDCIAFANATGGCMLLGSEDGQGPSQAGQNIQADLPDLLQRRLLDNLHPIGDR